MRISDWISDVCSSDLSVDPIELRDHQAIGPIEVSAIDMPHGPIKASGLIFSDGAHKIAYATDFSKFTDGMVDFFQGVDLFVIDALRRYPHPTHPHVAMTLEGLARVARSEEHTSELQSL